MERPLSERSDDPYQGSFRVLRDLPSDVEGVFAFSFYIPYEEVDLETNPYLLGISLYSKAIEEKDSLFSKWKIVLYTDAFTIRVLETRKVTSLLENPAVHLIVVRWPYYEGEDGKVNGDILRCMRLRAFFDFPTVPVFMRDADTLWAISDYETSAKTLDADVNRVSRWESNFLKGAQAHPNRLFFGTSLGYKRFWHTSKQLGLTAPLGAFAGLQSTMPVVPCFTSTALWEKALDYILSLSKRTETGFSNEHNTARIGKDEQILLYVFLPACWESVYFFETDLFATRSYALQNHSAHETNYPTYIFERGDNSNLRSLFRKAINTGFKQNLEKNRLAIENRNKTRERTHEEEIRGSLRGIENVEWKLNTRPPYFYTDTPTTAFRTVHALSKLFGSSDSRLSELIASYEALHRSLSQAKQEVARRMKVRDPRFDARSELELVQAQAQAKNKALEAVVQRALELMPKRDILAKVDYMTRNEVQKVLDYFTGVPIVPFAPEPVLKGSLGAYAKFFKKPAPAPKPPPSTNEFDFLQPGETLAVGGKRKTRRKRKGKKKTRKN